MSKEHDNQCQGYPPVQSEVSRRIMMEMNYNILNKNISIHSDS